MRKLCLRACKSICRSWLMGLRQVVHPLQVSYKVQDMMIVWVNNWLKEGMRCGHESCCVMELTCIWSVFPDEALGEVPHCEGRLSHFTRAHHGHPEWAGLHARPVVLHDNVTTLVPEHHFPPVRRRLFVCRLFDVCLQVLQYPQRKAGKGLISVWSNLERLNPRGRKEV